MQENDASPFTRSAATIVDAGIRVLTSTDPRQKVETTQRAADLWATGTVEIGCVNRTGIPDVPGRPDRPLLGKPKDMPKRSAVSVRGRIALLHSLAHIELNAIDLAWDLIVRFVDEVARFADPSGFIDDWLTVANEEALHFTLLEERLSACGSTYGDLPAHGGLWEAAQTTKEDLAGRLAIVPLVLEARGLDVSPNIIASLKRAGDLRSAEVLEKIYHDEIGHVRTGVKWFELTCRFLNADPKHVFESSLSRYFEGNLKGPFNHSARELANFPVDFVDN